MKDWQKKFSENDFHNLEKLMDLRCESNSMENSAAFSYGFKLGAIIMIEVLTEQNELIRK